MNEQGKRFLNVKEVASMLGVSRGRVYQLCEAGVLPYVRIGEKRGSVKFPVDAWDKWMAAQEASALAEVKGA